MQTASTKSGNRTTFSSYKQRNTAKFMLAISPCGAIIYTSEAYPGSLSDVKFVEVCGLLFAIEEGDDVMADKGFLLHHLLGALGASLIIPPKAYAYQDGYTAKQVQSTEQVANLRIHVERAMRSVQEFQILHKRLPIPQKDLATDIFACCALLSNFKGPLREEQDVSSDHDDSENEEDSN
jgi:hypothetical protein